MKPSQMQYVLFAKYYNIGCNFSTERANYANKQSTQEWTATALRLTASLHAQRNTFI